MDYYRYMREHYGLKRVEALWEVVVAWFKGDIENRSQQINGNEEVFNPDGIPTLFEVFSLIRATADDINQLKVATLIDPQLVYENLVRIGDYDEPLSMLIRDCLNGKLDQRGKKLLEHIISESA